MNFFKKIGKALSAPLKFASKIAGFVPGVGQLVGPALGVAGSVLGGGNMGSHIKSGIGGIGGGLGGVAGKAVGGAAGKGIGGLLGKGLSFATKNAEPIMAGLSAVEAMGNDRRSRKLQDRSLASAEGAYNEAAPLRQRGLQMASDMNPVDLSEIYRRRSNPFMRGR